MSYLVLHMDKFKKEAVRGIQSHNNLSEKVIPTRILIMSAAATTTICTNPPLETTPRPSRIALTTSYW